MKIRLTENDIHRIVESSVRKLMREYGLDYMHPFNDWEMDDDIENAEKQSRLERERKIDEAIKNVIRETSDEKLARAEAASMNKVKNAEKEYGLNSAVAKRAREQRNNFSNELDGRYKKGNLSKQARIEKARKSAKTAEEPKNCVSTKKKRFGFLPKR